MRERGTVCDARGGLITVRIADTPACTNCGACAEADGARTLEGVLDPLGAACGDVVEVDIPDVARRRAQWLVFVVPVMAIVLGYLAGFLLSGVVGVRPDTAGAVAGLLAGAVALFSWRFAGRDGSGSGRYEPRVHAIISRGSQRRSTDGPSSG